MKTNNEWKDFKLIASNNGMKLESYGNYKLLRPDPQVIWKTEKNLFREKGINAIYERSSDGGGKWNEISPMPKEFTATWRELKFNLKLMGFKHTGVFPEQAVNWDSIINLIKNAKRKISVLNLFAYTGGASLACLSAGASVCHVDSAKAMCDRARKNVLSSNLNENNIRYIIDDCVKFVEKEIRRGKTYDAIIMDPPSYGRGPKGEKWKLEEKIFDFVKLTRNVLSDKPLFYLINSYTTGLQPTVMANVLKLNFQDVKYNIDAYVIGIAAEDGITLPCGCSALMTYN